MDKDNPNPSKQATLTTANPQDERPYINAVEAKRPLLSSFIHTQTQALVWGLRL